jgi:putative transcription factor
MSFTALPAAVLIKQIIGRMQRPSLMPLTCEVCGAPIRTAPASVEIDGAILKVCPNCAKRGRLVQDSPVRVAGVIRPLIPRVAGAGVGAPTASADDSEMEIDPDYNVIVRQAREKLGLTQEALGMMINVKPSLIAHVETKKLKPDLAFAHKLMHTLKINLLVSTEDLENKER